MKSKNYLFFSIAGIISFSITSCGTDNSVNSDSKSSSKTEEKKVAFEGKYLTTASLDGEEPGTLDTGNYMIFRTDGTGEEKTYILGLEQFKWRKDNNQLCISKSYQLEATFDTLTGSNESCGKYTLTGNDLTWEIDGAKIYLIKN